MGKAILFQIIAGNGTMKIKKPIGTKSFRKYCQPKRKSTIPKSTTMNDVLWRKYSVPIFAMISCPSPAATTTMPKMFGEMAV